jgi:nitroreductase
MDTVDAIKTRRSVRAWTAQDVPEDVLNQILEAGRWSPSPLNSQPWHFTVVRNKETLKSLTTTAHHGAFLQNANLIIVVTVNKNDPNDPWLEEHDQHIYSAGGALEYMWLAAWNLGIGGVWITLDDATSRTILEIPGDQVIIGCLALGYPLGNPVPHRDMDRKPISEIVFFEKYGKLK